MTISDVIFESMSYLIKQSLEYYDKGERREMIDNEDIVELVALHLKICSKRSYITSDLTTKKLAELDAINWKEKAKDCINNDIDEYYPDEDDSSSESSESQNSSEEEEEKKILEKPKPLSMTGHRKIQKKVLKKS